MAQWWEHSPPTKVARVQFPGSLSYMGWVCSMLMFLRAKKRQRDWKRVLPILPTTSQLLCQKNFARANDPAGNAG